MVKPDLYRVAKYSAKLDPEAIKQRIESQKEYMVSQISSKFGELAEIETKVKEICESNNVPSVNIPFYIAYARQLYRIINTHPGTLTRKNEGTLIGKLWVGRGLTKAVLEEIAETIFGLNLTL